MYSGVDLGVRGKRILVTGGRAKEFVDGVRLYANFARAEDQGHRVARLLAQEGATVTLVTCKTELLPPENVSTVSAKPDGTPIVSAQDLWDACENLVGGPFSRHKEVPPCRKTNAFPLPLREGLGVGYIKRLAKQDLTYPPPNPSRRGRGILSFLWRHLVKAEEPSFDLFLHLACCASIKPAEVTRHKLKIKTGTGGAVALDVARNADLLQLGERFGACAGFDARQCFETRGLPREAWKSFVEAQNRQDRLIFGAPPAPHAATPDLKGKKIIVSSGPAIETITPYGDALTNFSSGRQGHAVACALADRGADVALIAGPVGVPDPVHSNIRTVHVRSAKDMLASCLAELPAEAYVGVAAVADFGVEAPCAPVFDAAGIARLSLIQNPDILETMGKHPAMRPRVVIGFAAETDDLEAYARGKLEKKNADAIFANRVGAASSVRGPSRNHVLRVMNSGVLDCGETDKYHVGVAIAECILSLSRAAGEGGAHEGRE